MSDFETMRRTPFRSGCCRLGLLGLGLFLLLGGAMVRAQEGGQKFSQSLTPEQRAAIGIEKLTPEQLAALDAAAEVFRHSAAEAATKQAVAEYRKHDEPGVIARALATFKRQDAEARKQHIFAHIVGRFNGWDGHTVFHLDNGQVWRQATSSMYYISSVQNPSAEIYQTSTGVYRLQLDEGPSVAVVRVQ